MAEISEAAKARAAALFNENNGDETWLVTDFGRGYPTFDAFARFIQEVSDAAKEVVPLCTDWVGNTREIGERCAAKLAPFILPEPADPLEDALACCGLFIDSSDWTENARLFRSALRDHGLKIVEG